MDIQYVILGLLSWQSFSGYALKKIISDSDLFYWSGNNNQIYNSLVQLHKDGMVTLEVDQESLPVRKIYSITAQGRAALKEWALGTPELPEHHNHFLIQLAWTEQLSDQEIDDLLRQYEEEIETQIKMRRHRAGKPAAAPDRSARETHLWNRISEHIAAAYQQEMNWVRQLRQELKTRAYNDTTEVG